MINDELEAERLVEETEEGKELRHSKRKRKKKMEVVKDREKKLKSGEKIEPPLED